MNLNTEQTILEDFDLWRIERVLPWVFGGFTEGIEDNIAQLYSRVTEENRKDSIEIFLDSMHPSEREAIEQGCPYSLPDGFPFNIVDDRFVEQEPVSDSSVRWRVLWESEVSE